MQVVLYKKSTGDQTHYYSIDDREESLFHPHAVTIRWGRSLENGRERHFYFSTMQEKNKKIRSILKDKLREYQVLYSYFKDRSSGTKNSDVKDLLSHMP